LASWLTKGAPASAVPYTSVFDRVDTHVGRWQITAPYLLFAAECRALVVYPTVILTGLLVVLEVSLAPVGEPDPSSLPTASQRKLL
jgi:hypothetical protein